ncbi:hypothetical protein [Streptomyces sp. NPDC015125]|uniref:hypothetical protein n=1 Tax=Streptomyces sp. NPDC015125 TaxID=3364938 RepID=UPI00370253CE
MTATKTTDTSAAEAQEKEAEATATSDGYVTVPLQGYEVTKDVQVMLATKWRASAIRAANSGDIDRFMEMVLHEDDYETYLDLDPDQESIMQFTQDAAERSGEALGKSSGPSRSGKNTRRR